MIDLDTYTHIGHDRKRELEHQLLINIKKNHELLCFKFEAMTYEDSIYRLYHGSFKAITRTVAEVLEIMELFRKIAPDGCHLAPLFEDIVNQGFNLQVMTNTMTEYESYARKSIESYFHVRYFLEQAVYYGQLLDRAPDVLPAGWAALLELYQIR